MSDAPRPFTCLVVEDDDELRELIGFLIESKFKAEVKYASSGNQALAILKKDASVVDLVISDNRMADGDGTDLFRGMFEAQITTPFILCSSDTPQMYPEFSLRPLTAYVAKPVIQGPLVQAIRDFLSTRGPLAEQTISPALGDFVRIHVRLLKLAGKLPGEAFIRVSENKFVRTYQQGDTFTDEEFEKNRIKNIEFLYIKQLALPLFLDLLVEKHAKEQLDIAVSINQYVEATIQDIGSRLGFTQALERMTKESLKRTIKIIEKNPTLSETLKYLSLNHKNYVSAHSTLISCISCWMAGKMGWQSEEVLTKLILASLIHDIHLNDEEVAKLQVENDLLEDHTKITAEGVKLWREHSAKAAAIAARFSDIPKDVDTIILQHHERPHGEGIPGHLDHTRIGPLSSLFIISHELSNVILKAELEGESLDMGALIQKFVAAKSSFFDVGHFKSIMEKLAEKTPQTT